MTLREGSAILRTTALDPRAAGEGVNRLNASAVTGVGAWQVSLVDGSPPDLRGQVCEELLCQQYWYDGALADEADVVLLQVRGGWFQLCLDGGAVHWGSQPGEPVPRKSDTGTLFAYPLVDLGSRLGVRGHVISDWRVEDTEGGETVFLEFECGSTVQFVNQGDSTRVAFTRDPNAHVEWLANVGTGQGTG